MEGAEDALLDAIGQLSPAPSAICCRPAARWAARQLDATRISRLRRVSRLEARVHKLISRSFVVARALSHSLALCCARARAAGWTLRHARRRASKLNKAPRRRKRRATFHSRRPSNTPASIVDIAILQQLTFVLDPPQTQSTYQLVAIVCCFCTLHDDAGHLAANLCLALCTVVIGAGKLKNKN